MVSNSPITVVPKIIKYTDLDLNFTINPTTGDVARSVGDMAVIRSVQTLILTNFYERPFHPEVGSIVNHLLFNLNTPLLGSFISRGINEVITNFEPRVSITNVTVDQSSPSGINITVTFFILNSAQPTSISMFLERIR